MATGFSELREPWALTNSNIGSAYHISPLLITRVHNGIYVDSLLCRRRHTRALLALVPSYLPCRLFMLQALAGAGDKNPRRDLHLPLLLSGLKEVTEDQGKYSVKLTDDGRAGIPVAAHASLDSSMIFCIRERIFPKFVWFATTVGSEQKTWCRHFIIIVDRGLEKT